MTDLITCPNCGGEGKLDGFVRSNPNDTYDDCGQCKGAGQLDKAKAVKAFYELEPCPDCKGDEVARQSCENKRCATFGNVWVLRKAAS